MSVIKIATLDDLEISMLEKAVDETVTNELFIEFDCIGGRPSHCVGLQSLPIIPGRLVTHDTETQLWAFSTKALKSSFQKHKERRAKALKEMNNA